MRWKKTCSLSGLNATRLRATVTECNQNSLPLINEWLEEAAHQLAEPIDWTTFGVFPSVSLITVNPPTFPLCHHKKTAQRKSFFLSKICLNASSKGQKPPSVHKQTFKCANLSGSKVQRQVRCAAVTVTVIRFSSLQGLIKSVKAIYMKILFFFYCSWALLKADTWGEFGKTEL